MLVAHSVPLAFLTAHATAANVAAGTVIAATAINPAPAYMSVCMP